MTAHARGAAARSRRIERLGATKQLLLVEGEPLVRRAARALLATRPDALFVVVGARADEVYAAVVDLAPRIHRVDCDDWQRGLSASLRAGITALPEGVDGALVALCDQPAMDASHLEALVQISARTPRSCDCKRLRRRGRCTGIAASRRGSRTCSQ